MQSTPAFITRCGDVNYMLLSMNVKGSGSRGVLFLSYCVGSKALRCFNSYSMLAVRYLNNNGYNNVFVLVQFY